MTWLICGECMCSYDTDDGECGCPPQEGNPMTKTIEALVEALEHLLSDYEEAHAAHNLGETHGTILARAALALARAEQSNQLSGNSGGLNLIARAEQAEPVAWLVYAGILDMRPVYPAYNTKELAESAAACIKSNTEVRPLYLAPPAAPAKLEPLSAEEIAEPFKPFRTSASAAFVEGVRFAEAAHNAKLGGT